MTRGALVLAASLLVGCNLFQGTEMPSVSDAGIFEDVSIADASADLPAVADASPDLAIVQDMTVDQGPADLGTDTGPDMADLGPDTDADADVGPRLLGLDPAQRVQIDFGEPGNQTAGWNNINENDGALLDLRDTSGGFTPVDIAITNRFSGRNSNGRTDNALGWPSEATMDSMWSGSFDGHDAALLESAQIQFTNLEPQKEYDLRIFGSRSGLDEGGRGRLSRYTVGGVVIDIDAVDNIDQTADFVVTADQLGTAVIDITVSPEGDARFAYVNVIELTGR